MKNTSDNLEICSQICESKCCKSTPPALTNFDIERIKKKITNQDWYTTINSNQKQAKVVSKKAGSNDCFFLSFKGTCEIYDDRPLDCKLFPLFVKIKKVNSNEYNIKWLIWYCPLTNKSEIEDLKINAEKLIVALLSENPDQIFEYQEGMFISGGYKKKHFFKEECLKI